MKNKDAKKRDDFRSKLGFRFHDITMSKDKSVTTKTIKVFWNEKAPPQNSVLNYEIDLFFPEDNFSIEADEKVHTDRNIDYKLERQKSAEEKVK